MAFKVSTLNWDFSDVHTLFTVEKTCPVAALVPGKDSAYSTIFSALLYRT